ncbi:MAG TPA: phosphoribosylamine--glycine ligase [archaeon]|nr:phosphoribosylamine--glycine ligase [archaeon]
MNVLVIGSGGREHTLVWKIAQSPLIEKVFCAPGNAGIAEIAEIVPLSAGNKDALIEFCIENSIDLVVIGPEQPLVEGLVDELERNGINAFGPKKDAAIIEGSKVFAKEFMKKFNIPTADFKVFTNSDSAIEFIKGTKKQFVIKADGLAAGKGVIIPKNKEEALHAVQEIMESKKFGEAGNQIIIEDKLEGEEVSVIILSDGVNILPMVESQDHKRALDNDKGLNTGGMGAYSPAPVIDEKLRKEITETILLPAIQGMASEGRTFKGVLYAGLMISKEKKPFVLEFNARFGDPETQVILPRLKSDLVELMLACNEGTLSKVKAEWYYDSACCVVLASGGYPEEYEKGKIISGLNEAKKIQNVIVFHAGTLFNEGNYLTNGGRVLSVTGMGANLSEAIKKVYEGVSVIAFDEMHFRKDIGKRALK